MEAHTCLTALLDCGYLDADYLIRLIEAYDLDLAELTRDVADYR